MSGGGSCAATVVKGLVEVIGQVTPYPISYARLPVILANVPTDSIAYFCTISPYGPSLAYLISLTRACRTSDPCLSVLTSGICSYGSCTVRCSTSMGYAPTSTCGTNVSISLPGRAHSHPHWRPPCRAAHVRPPSFWGLGSGVWGLGSRA
eukprot:279508-Rhodomonas_salina.1